MPTASEKAKAKYQEVLEQAKINNAHRKYTSEIHRCSVLPVSVSTTIHC